jgi:succinate dehydrogenase / fumarate reductase flavoprotein subunit
VTDTAIKLDSKVPAGPIEERWDSYKFNAKLVNPANKRKYEIIVVGTGLAGASAAATLAELGYKVKAFTFHDSPSRSLHCSARAVSRAKNHHGDGDSIYRLFYDTVKARDSARSERVSLGPSCRRHHRPVCLPGRSVRS